MNQPVNSADALDELKLQYEQAKTKKLNLNMSRGKPAPSQLDLSNGLLKTMDTYITADGTDARNYGIGDGIPECKKLFADLLGLQPQQIIMGGNSSLSMMFDTLASMCLFGTGGSTPWHYYRFQGTPVKFLCPAPGYDRHFRICQELGIGMIPVPLTSEGPDMEMVASLAKKDPLIKGIWCVPLHSNPEGICYSDQVVDQLASMETAADDFRIFWDNAYGIHHIYEKVELMNILEACERHHHPDRAYYFFSTSKITFPGTGLALIASNSSNVAEIKRHMSAQIISYDKINQLRHVQYFQTPENILSHMDRLAQELRPKFDLVLSKLENQFGGTGLASWSTPKGGYFISLYTPPGCAKRTVALAKEAGVTLTDAGATYPYGKDEADRNIRIAPSYPTLEELDAAMDIFILCIKIAALENK
ncbi:aminotransferase class I/II-fold pyridoxal phosphate-dependent enzyme [[Clostridium] scindens]|uniref:Aminotransferase n=1 Tax=Clostridium scindens (strain ATCC 35704 / DSM 5676 / VPI 13733 / 19) TaxID=411468 RepID=B0NA79_CLOS5|nr:aminotransferase class I/II-fold pyridoxal phosphate-dependent enzyme [[Clostridium] scindens]EDS08572.1 aminotransferase, class I/II [[Clostridium] scindens ATCC 35704]QBF73014.1 Putative aminotransferase [[Clostridium] scindens ATCC 35704]QRO36370.1 aminotransferase class I/II-fold pyridoxal phosphate-dependent enzyme [[Clostridium] scindens]WPB35785.1 Putative aminotransferase [[Clostridium] scindens]BDF17512.1 putative aminotransferase [[Clostridium] scindens]